MRRIDLLIEEYGESHQNGINKLIHWIFVPAIMFSLIGLLSLIPFPLSIPYFNWATLVLLLALFYYLRLSITMFLSFCVICIILLRLVNVVIENKIFNLPSAAFFISVFIVAWIFQFIGHHIEGKKPSFFKDLQFLLIGPAWLLHFVFKKIGLGY
ncbi:MAG TPA: DUF962 domain-containing protein [Saprospiraceae bacterium]|nr:DUF962 domain-containing protein [Saprospiraceae bacterium]